MRFATPSRKGQAYASGKLFICNGVILSAAPSQKEYLLGYSICGARAVFRLLPVSGLTGTNQEAAELVASNDSRKTTTLAARTPFPAHGSKKPLTSQLSVQFVKPR